MKRYLLLSLAIVTLSGCSELHAIGSATVRELRADAINVELNSYVRPQVAEEAPQIQKAVLVKVEKPVLAKASKARRKGLWEKI